MANFLNVSFVTFGMFIIDEIEWQTPNPPPAKHDLIGGAGTYAVLGARLASSPCQLLSRSISWIVDQGSDFPANVEKTIHSWNTDCVLRHDTTRLTTRAWNGYGDNEHRSFNYLTPKVRLEVSSLSPKQTMSKSFHMVCSPERCLNITTKLSQRRHEIKHTNIDPAYVVIWEPIPDVCSPEELETLRQAASGCSIISPNHDELKMFFSPDITQTSTQAQLVTRLMSWNNPHNTANQDLAPPVPIIREGSNGSTAYFPNPQNKNNALSIHLPAYHTPSTSASVIDPTGGGNTYLGALAIALTDALHSQPTYSKICKYLNIPPFKDASSFIGSGLRPNLLSSEHLFNSITVAMVYALIAASFAIEQNGVPELEQRKVFTEISEYWNGEKFIDRLEKYLGREGGEIKSQLDRVRGN